MSKAHRAAGWGGPRVTRLRQLFAQRIAEAAAKGEPIQCWRCEQPITPADEWDIGHKQDVSDGGSMWALSNMEPEHRGQCNRAAGARVTNEKKRAKRLRKRSWL